MQEKTSGIISFIVTWLITTSQVYQSLKKLQLHSSSENSNCLHELTLLFLLKNIEVETILKYGYKQLSLLKHLLAITLKQTGSLVRHRIILGALSNNPSLNSSRCLITFCWYPVSLRYINVRHFSNPCSYIPCTANTVSIFIPTYPYHSGLVQSLLPHLPSAWPLCHVVHS